MNTFNMNMGEKILNVLKETADAEWEYHNPHFLSAVADIIEDYYAIRDEKVDEWIGEMFGA